MSETETKPDQGIERKKIRVLRVETGVLYGLHSLLRVLHPSGRVEEGTFLRLNTFPFTFSEVRDLKKMISRHTVTRLSYREK